MSILAGEIDTWLAFIILVGLMSLGGYFWPHKLLRYTLPMISTAFVMVVAAINSSTVSAADVVLGSAFFYAFFLYFGRAFYKGERRL
ncbi:MULTISPECIES: hypothetical protein [unclassified Psychrobacter]|uniref:hypothetical protein n=1 Tax=unclassified Psychrobacter TaxID=196806 RepID=UPI000946A32C|nr:MULTISPECIES: hypothetical protein [unclassified Psychrobacter]OLF38124.1 hypothetical protein BTV98_04565 [Psychrobacter sp. Cmf 22.2]